MGIIIDREYHVVELNLTYPPAEVFEWLQLRLGPGDGTRWWYRHNKLFFANPGDHMMFLLKWGNE